MKFTAWEPKRHIERKYQTALKKLTSWLMRQISHAQTIDDILNNLNDAAQSPQLDQWAHAAAKRMVTSTLNEDAKTWREAAREGSEGRTIYEALQNELKGPVGVRYRELINENAQYIKSVPQKVAEQIVKKAGTYTPTGGRDLESEIKQYVGQMSDSHINLIARTETAKSQASLRQAQAEQLNKDWYIWRAQRDVRTRKSHKLMDGVLYRFSDPPSPEELAGEKRTYGHYNPGMIFNCRCWAQVVYYWYRVTWPHKVYANGTIQTMTKHEFEQRFGEKVE